MPTELVRWADSFPPSGEDLHESRRSLCGLHSKAHRIGAFSLGKGKGKGRNGKGGASCDKCGKSGHTADQCLADHVCSKCGKKGHRADKCWPKHSTSRGQRKVKVNQFVHNESSKTAREVEREAPEAAGHTPYRDWCAHGVAGAGRGDQHLQTTAPENVNLKLVIAADYGHLDDCGTTSEQRQFW